VFELIHRFHSDDQHIVEDDVRALQSSRSAHKVMKVDASSIHWALSSRHIVVVQSIGETLDGRLVEIDVTQAMAVLSNELNPLKVMFINDHGGIVDENGQVCLILSNSVGCLETIKVDFFYSVKSCWGGGLDYELDHDSIL